MKEKNSVFDVSSVDLNKFLSALHGAGFNANLIKKIIFSSSNTLAKKMYSLVVSNEKTISVNYKYEDEKDQEIEEIIELDLEKSLKSYLAFYRDNDIDLPDDFEEKVKDIWSRNKDAMQESVEKSGFDEMLIIPGGLSLPDLHQKMTKGYMPTYEGDEFQEDGSFTDVKELKNGTKIVLVHKRRAQNLEDRPELKAILGKEANILFQRQEKKLQLSDYLVYQRKYFQEEKKYLDDICWTWLPGSKSGSFFVCSGWDPEHGRLSVASGGAGEFYGAFGHRLSRCFT